MNPLNDYPAIRKVLYVLQWLANLVMGVLGIVFLNDSDEGVPQAFTVTGLVLAFVWTYTGLTAAGNTPTTDDKPDDEAGEANTLLLLVVAALILAVLAIFGVRLGD